MMIRLIVILAGLGLCLYYALTCAILLVLMVPFWLLKQMIAGIRWLQERL